MSKHKLIEKDQACLWNVSSPVNQARLLHPTVHSAEAAFHKVVPGGQGLCLSHSLQCDLGLEQSLVPSWSCVDRFVSFVTSGSLNLFSPQGDRNTVLYPKIRWVEHRQCLIRALSLWLDTSSGSSLKLSTGVSTDVLDYGLLQHYNSNIQLT